MTVPPYNWRRETGIWDRKGLRDYSAFKSHLPVIEETVTPLGPSKFQVDATVASFDDVSVVRLSHDTLSVGTTVLDPAYLAFLIVVPKNKECLVNGEVVLPSVIFMPGAQGGYHIRGAGRASLAMVMRRNKLREMLAALQGIDPQGVSLTDRKLELPQVVVTRLRHRLIDLLERCGSDGMPRDKRGRPFKIADEVFSLAADAYLGSHTNADWREPRSFRPPEQIVRMAEEHFLAAEGEPVSLADLCKATGVGKTRLYAAFAHICGEPPLSYFHKRQLMQARSILLNSDAKWGAVKRAAFSAGLTELGRFSVEYRQLFGESPSATLRDTN